ncbi:MAG: hypothetical protein ABIF19_04200 [Planctomycetota bacterium]
MNGSCDVKGCDRETYLGWRPLTESRGRQICEGHWRRHQDPEDSFDLFEAFGFRRPAGIRKPVPKKDVPRPAPALDPGRTGRMQPAAEPEPPREKLERHEPAKPRPQTIPTIDRPSGCRTCGAEREPGHTYCPKCSRGRKKQSDRERQKRRYHKMQKPHVFVLK